MMVERRQRYVIYCFNARSCSLTYGYPFFFEMLPSKDHLPRDHDGAVHGPFPSEDAAKADAKRFTIFMMELVTVVFRKS